MAYVSLHFQLCERMCIVVQLCLTLCDSLLCSLPGSSVHGILQASGFPLLPEPPGTLSASQTPPNAKIKSASLECSVKPPLQDILTGRIQVSLLPG